MGAVPLVKLICGRSVISGFQKVKMGHVNMKIRLNRYIWGFIVIICLAIAMRINNLRVLGYYGDMIGFNAPWAYYIRYWGLFRIYIMSPTTNYPPIFCSSWMSSLR